MSARQLATVGGAIRSFWDRLEASRLPRLQTSEILGAVTVACLIFLVILFRWLGT